MVGRFLQDVSYGARTLVSKPGFTIVAVITLALGIGANSAIFSVVNGVLLRSLPYQNPDRLMLLWEANNSLRQVPVSHMNFVDWRAQQRSFEYISAYSAKWGGPLTILGGSEPERAYVVSVYRDFFNVFGVAPVVGRVFLPEETQPGATPVVVVSNNFWQRRLGGNFDLSNKRLQIYGRSFNVIGVLPPGFNFPDTTDLWICKEQVSDTSSRSSHNYVGIGRLRPGITRAQAQAEMTAIMRRITEQNAEDNKHDDVNVISLKDQLTGSIQLGLWIVFGGVVCVLLIACANVANLQLARSLGRQKELAIRAALGAGRVRIVWQLMTECLLLAFLGGALGLLIAYWLVRVLIAVGPTTIPRLNEISLDTRTVVFTIGVSLLTCLLFGLLPALRVSRPDLSKSLNESARGSSGGSSFVRSTLVISEIALTLVLLVGAGLLIKSLWHVMQVPAGFRPEGLMTMHISLPDSAYDVDAKKIAFYQQLLERLKTVPGVETAGMVNNLPMGGVNLSGQLSIAGRPEDQYGYTNFRVVSADYFRALEIPLLKGRLFNDSDNESSEPVAIISQRVAETSFKNEEPLGQRVLSTNDVSPGEDKQIEKWPKIIGIVGDVKHFGLELRNAADLYVYYKQRPRRIGDMTVAVRTNREPAAIASTLREQVKTIDAHLPVSFEAMDEVVARSTAYRRYNVILLSAFAALALLLAVIGIYGVMSYAVTQSTREIGIRLALGAQKRHVLKLIVGQGLILTLVGALIGMVAALALTRLMTSLLFGVKPTDPITFIFVTILLTAIGLLGCYLPARRATRVDPMVTLRYE